MAENPSQTPADDSTSPGDSVDARRRHPGVRYDATDISLRGVITVLAGIAVVFAVLGTAVWWTVQSQAPGHPPPGAATSYTTPSERLPSQPRLEELNVFAGGPAANVFERQLAQQKALHGYGPTPESSYVHIPIDEAIKREAAHLPVRPHPPNDTKSLGLVGAGESSSGRLLQETPPWQE